MIKNEKQYRIARAEARRFADAIEQLATQARPRDISPRLWNAQKDAAISQLAELQGQIDAYQELQTGLKRKVVLESVEDLPKALIEARILSGMTQEGLAKRLGVKTQQVQRYEATEYSSASFTRIRQVLKALGLQMPKPATLIRQR